MSQFKVQVKRSDFFNLVSQAYGLIEKRSVMPILSKVLIEAKKNKLCIQATDQDNSLQSQISAEVEVPGKVLVDAQNLYDILKELPEGKVSLSQSHQKLKLKQKASIFNLLSLNVQDFPAFPPFQMKNSFRIDSELLKHLIEKASYCASVDETRYHLTGVFFEAIEQNKIKFFRFVATDGHRLGLAQCPCEKRFLEKGVIISKKGVQEIKKLSSQALSEVEVAVTPPRILFRYEETVLSVKLVEGNYPNYQPLIPKNSVVSVVLDTDLFSHALRRVSLLSSNRFKGVNFHVGSDKIRMEAENPDLGSAQDEVVCENKAGKSLKVRFNSRYILEALMAMGSEKIQIEFGGSEAPCVIAPQYREKEEKKKASLCVIMPMKM